MAENKKIYLTPGPTELYPEVKKFIAESIDKDICCLSHRSQQFMDIYKHTFDNLKQLLNILLLKSFTNRYQRAAFFLKLFSNPDVSTHRFLFDKINTEI